MSESEEERRPQPIGVGGGSEDDSDRNSDGEEDPSRSRAEPEVAAPQGTAEEPSKKSKSNRRAAFSGNDLVKEKGLLKIYKDFPRKCQLKGKGREVWREF